MDCIPLLICWLLRMQVDQIIDRVVGLPHGNWRGISPGKLALVYVAYVLHQCTHVLQPMEAWVQLHQHTLRLALGEPIIPADCTDDRLEILLDRLGKEPCVGEQVLQQLGQHAIRVYALPTAGVRIDFTSVSVFHKQIDDDSLLQFGRSKDHRPDLRQFKLALGTLDPLGIPLVTTLLSGEQSDDPHYIDTYEKAMASIGHRQVLVVGDCKMASLQTRTWMQVKGSRYLTPLPMNQNVAKELEKALQDRTNRSKKVYSVDEEGIPRDEEPEDAIGEGFVLETQCEGKHPETGEQVTWTEQRFVVCSYAHAERQIEAMQAKVAKAEKELNQLQNRFGQNEQALKEQVDGYLKKSGIEGLLKVEFRKEIREQRKYKGRGRPGVNSKYVMEKNESWQLEVTRDEAEMARQQGLLGWRMYASNTTPQELGLQAAVASYRESWQPERGFHRLKKGMMSIAPIWLKKEERIRGLVLLLTIALMALTLVEYVVRRDLYERKEKVQGLHDLRGGKKTDRPTTERMLKAFEGIHLVILVVGEQEVGYVTPLNPLQKLLLERMGLPDSIYAAPVPISAPGYINKS